MIKTSKDMKTVVNEKMRDGNGSAILEHLLGEDDMAKGSRMFSKITLKENCSIGLHTHYNETEYYYILEGTGMVEENDGIKYVAKGDLVITKDQESHSIANTGKDDLVFIALIILD